jgi:hypothetical protein
MNLYYTALHNFTLSIIICIQTTRYNHIEENHISNTAGYAYHTQFHILRRRSHSPSNSTRKVKIVKNETRTQAREQNNMFMPQLHFFLPTLLCIIYCSPRHRKKGVSFTSPYIILMVVVLFLTLDLCEFLFFLKGMRVREPFVLFAFRIYSA